MGDQASSSVPVAPVVSLPPARYHNLKNRPINQVILKHNSEYSIYYYVNIAVKISAEEKHKEIHFPVIYLNQEIYRLVESCKRHLLALLSHYTEFSQWYANHLSVQPKLKVGLPKMKFGALSNDLHAFVMQTCCTSC